MVRLREELEGLSVPTAIRAEPRLRAAPPIAVAIRAFVSKKPFGIRRYEHRNAGWIRRCTPCRPHAAEPQAGHRNALRQSPNCEHPHWHRSRTGKADLIANCSIGVGDDIERYLAAAVGYLRK